MAIVSSEDTTAQPQKGPVTIRKHPAKLESLGSSLNQDPVALLMSQTLGSALPHFLISSPQTPTT